MSCASEWRASTCQDPSAEVVLLGTPSAKIPASASTTAYLIIFFCLLADACKATLCRIADLGTSRETVFFCYHGRLGKKYPFWGSRDSGWENEASRRTAGWSATERDAL